MLARKRPAAAAGACSCCLLRFSRTFATVACSHRVPRMGSDVLVHYLISACVIGVIFDMCFPVWYHKRLVRDALNEATVRERLDTDLRGAIEGILETGRHRDLVNWIRQNEDKLPAELSSTTKKAEDSYSALYIAFTTLLLTIPCCIFIAKVFYGN